jgi:VanZ family protein
MAQQTPIRFLSRYAPLVIWLLLISFASTDEFSANNTSRFIGPLVLWLFPHISEGRLELIHFLTRKLAHFSEYAILAILSARAFRTSRNTLLSRHWFLISLALIILYALLDEYHQSFVPSRTASVFDSFIDMSGGIAALAVMSWRRTFQRSAN